MAPVALLLAVVLLLAGCGGGDDSGERTTPQPPRDPTLVAGGTTAVELDGALVQLLDLTGVRIEPTGEARRVGGQLRFPITGGRLDTARPGGQVEHAGGLRVRAGSRTVEARRLVVDVRARELTGEIEGVRAPLFALRLAPTRAAPDADPAVVEGTLRTPEQSVLEDRLGIPLPGGGLQVGELVVSAERP